MQDLKNLIPNQQWESSYKPLSSYEKAERDAEGLSALEGKLDKSIYDCHICKNRGYTFVVAPDDYYKGEQTYSAVHRPCSCMAIRKSIKNMRDSGLEPIIKKSTFDKYEATEPWQQKAKEKAQGFVRDIESLEKKCFFIGGGVGSGKTHLCTAIVREFLLKGIPAKYMLWVDESQRLKTIVNEPEFESVLEEYLKAKVLYIDDLFKITRDKYGKEVFPTDADIKLAYRIINYRYQHDELITIISSERFIDEIERIDSATGSRIYEMTQNDDMTVSNALAIGRDRSRNYRLRNMEII